MNKNLKQFQAMIDEKTNIDMKRVDYCLKYHPSYLVGKEEEIVCKVCNMRVDDKRYPPEAR